jgi:hypothetical protein
MAVAGAPQCTVCGAPARPGARFCGECGAVVDPSIPPGGVPASKAQPAPPTRKGGSIAPPPEPSGTRRSRRKRDKTVEMEPPDAQAPTDPALVLGLGPAGAPLPPIAVPPPSDDDDDDDQPTQSRKAPPMSAAAATRPSPQPAPPLPPAALAPAALAPAAPVVVPPPAASPAAEAPPSGGGEKTEFQRLLEEVEFGFESILSDDAAPATSGTATSEFDSAEVQTLFEQIAVAHARPVRDFMVEIKLGEPPVSWISFCRPAVKALERSAHGMDLRDLAAALDGFATALDLAAEQSGPVVRDQARQMVIDAYGDLIAKMPQAFGLELESNRREAVIVHALLAQVPGLHKVGIDRLYAHGMTSLALYWVARPADLVEAARLEPSVAQRVVERFATYRKEAVELAPDDGRAAELNWVDALISKLERNAAAYEEAAAQWSPAANARRQELRRERAEAMAQLRLLLARLGEVDLLERVEALPAGPRVAALREFVAEARRGWKPPPESVPRPIG